MVRWHLIISSSLLLNVVLLDFNGAEDPHYAKLWPPFSHQDSPEKACIADVGAITRGSHRFLNPTCQILYCPPDPNIHEVTVIECDDYVNKTNLPENFPDTDKRMYLLICQYCKPSSPTTDPDLEESNSTTPLTEESQEAPARGCNLEESNSTTPLPEESEEAPARGCNVDG